MLTIKQRASNGNHTPALPLLVTRSSVSPDFTGLGHCPHTAGAEVAAAPGAPALGCMPPESQALPSGPPS